MPAGVLQLFASASESKREPLSLPAYPARRLPAMLRSKGSRPRRSKKLSPAAPGGTSTPKSGVAPRACHRRILLDRFRHDHRRGAGAGGDHALLLGGEGGVPQALGRRRGPVHRAFHHCMHGAVHFENGF